MNLINCTDAKEQQMQVTMTNNEIIDYLRAVKERLFTYGWRRHEIGTPDGPNCFLGALYAVSGQEHILTGRATFHDGVIAYNNVSPVVRMFEKVLPDQVAAQFNDNCESFDTLVNAIDRSIKSLEGE